ncbi:TIGR03118 family protein [Rugamonas brunnea]|nr:TIGR03118 family protein [Rugamonas brunnea]
MNTSHRLHMFAGLGLALFLTACGGGYGGSSYMPPAAPPPVVTSSYTVTSLVSDAVIAAAHTDVNLVNGWGVAFNPKGYVWVADNGTNKSTLYDGNGVPQSLVVSTPDAPTGIVYNGTTDFKLTQGGGVGASPFLFATESGMIAAWAPSVNATTAVTTFDGSTAGAVYKGLAIGSFSGVNYLYAADFHNMRVDVFDTTFTRVSLPGGFTDPGLPAGYAPFGIQVIGDRVYVAYAKRAATGDDEQAGAGFGVLDVYTTGGALIRQLVNGGALNAPWGIAMAPADFGSNSNMLLVGNFGDGKINVYDPADGSAKGTLNGADGMPLVVDGLWGIAFGNGLNSQPTNTLFFAAGPKDEAHGQYGRIDLK